MNSAKLYFSDKSTLELKENDILIPIVGHNSGDDFTSGMDKSIELYSHVHNGLIPALMDAFVKCDFFYVNHDYNTVYNSKAVVKITLI